MLAEWIDSLIFVAAMGVVICTLGLLEICLKVILNPTKEK